MAKTRIDSRTERRPLAIVVGKNLKARRLILGLSREKLAGMLGCDRSVIDRFEQGQSIPLDLAPVIEESLQLSSVQELFEVDSNKLVRIGERHDRPISAVPNLSLIFQIPTGQYDRDSVGNQIQITKELLVKAIGGVERRDRLSLKATCLEPKLLPVSITAKTQCLMELIDPISGRFITGKFTLISTRQWHVNQSSKTGCQIEGWID